jgi:steroid delta-isomerase-like uncharacterized protein
MSTKALIEKYYEYFNAGKSEAFLALLDDEVVHDINQGAQEVGKPAFKKFIGMMSEHYKEKASNIVIMVSEDGKRAAAEFVIDGVYLKTAEGLPPAKNQKYHLDIGTFFSVNNGKVTRVTNYYNVESWLKQI